MWEDNSILKNKISGNPKYSLKNFAELSQVAAETENEATI